jgi:hypothetical protein
LNRRRLLLVLIAAGLAAIIGGQTVLRYLDWQTSEAVRTEVVSGLTAASGLDKDRLQVLATAACNCTRSKGDALEEACWQDYKAATAPFALNGVGTACAPVSTEMDCIATAAGETCIVTGYSVNAGSGDASGSDLCTVEEARAVEQAYQQGWLGPDGKEPDPQDSADWDASNSRANAAVNQVLGQIAKGKRIAAASPVKGGCTS